MKKLHLLLAALALAVAGPAFSANIRISSEPITRTTPVSDDYFVVDSPVVDNNTAKILASAFVSDPVALVAGQLAVANSGSTITTYSGLTSDSSGNLGAHTVNHVTVTSPATSATLTLAQGSSLITSGAFAYTILGTASVTETWPSTSFSTARIDAAQTFTGQQTFSSDVTAHTVTVGLGAGSVSSNTAVGASALSANTTGSTSVAVGYQAMSTVTTPSQSVAVGYQALQNVNNSLNVGVGYQALLGSSATGYSNVGVGALTYASLTYGSYNVAVGYGAFQYANGGNSYDTYVGGDSVGNNTSDSGQSTYLGSNSGSTGTVSNVTALGYGAIATAPNQMVYGNSSVTQQKMNGLLSTSGDARVVTAFTATSSATLANVTGLSATVVASGSYNFHALLFTTATSGGGVQAAISGTATATSVIYEGVLVSGGSIVNQTRATSLGSAVGSSATATAGTITIDGEITVNAAGTLTVQFAQNTSNAAASTVLAGSYLKVWQSSN